LGARTADQNAIVTLRQIFHYRQWITGSEKIDFDEMSLASQDALDFFVFLSSVPLLVSGDKISIVVITALVAALTSRYASRTLLSKNGDFHRFSRRRGDDRWWSLRGGAGTLNTDIGSTHPRC